MLACHELRTQRGSFCPVQHVPLRGTLSILLALRNFCLAERVLDAHSGFGGDDFNIHPELPTVILNDPDIRSMYTPGIAWRVRFQGHILFEHCRHSRLAGCVCNVVSKFIMPLAYLAPVTTSSMQTTRVKLQRHSLAARRGVLRLARRTQVFVEDPI